MRFNEEIGSGITLVLIVGAFVGGAGLMMMQKDTQNKRFQKSASTRSTVNVIAERIQSSLMNIKSCSKTLENKKFGDTVKYITLVDPLDKPLRIFISGKSYDNDSVKIDKISIVKDPDNSGHGLIKIHFSRKSKITIGGKKVLRIVPVLLDINSTGVIQSCIANMDGIGEIALKDSCKASGGTIDISKSFTCTRGAFKVYGGTTMLCNNTGTCKSVFDWIGLAK